MLLDGRCVGKQFANVIVGNRVPPGGWEVTVYPSIRWTHQCIYNHSYLLNVVFVILCATLHCFKVMCTLKVQYEKSR